MKIITFFHRNRKAGFSINKVTQTVIEDFSLKNEFYVPCYNASLVSILRNIFFVCVHKQRHSVNHITGDIHYCIIGLLGCTSVLTIHDLVTLSFHKHSFFKKKFIEWLWFRIPLKFATKVVCISEETKKEVARYTNRKDILVIHNAVSPIIHFSPKLINLECPRILCVGTGKNKNLLNTFEALKNIKCKIVIIGKLNQCMIDYLKATNLNYENLTNLSDKEMLEEYKKCDIVSFISLYEGFGMPVVEAHAMGRPVICSNIPVLKEVAANAAEFANPLDPIDIRRSFLKLLNNAQYCEYLIECGKKNALRFQKKDIFNQWSNLYNSL